MGQPIMTTSYVALIHPPENGSGFGVTFPDLPGCVSAGMTREEAILNAAEAAGGHIAAMRADGDSLPVARDFRMLQTDPEVAGDIAAGAEPSRIAVSEMPAPRERVNIMLGRDVLRQIDRAAAAQGVSRSAFIERAAGREARRRTG
jgi:predicted RNase H-like HicB family nuclease